MQNNTKKRGPVTVLLIPVFIRLLFKCRSIEIHDERSCFLFECFCDFITILGFNFGDCFACSIIFIECCSRKLYNCISVCTILIKSTLFRKCFLGAGINPFYCLAVRCVAVNMLLTASVGLMQKSYS